MRASASRTSLFLICAYGMRDDVPKDRERPNPYAAFGLAHHDALDQMASGHDPDLLAIADARGLSATQRLMFPRGVAALRDLDAQHLAASEVALALDMATGEARELGRRIGRRYREHGATATDFCGSADLAWMSEVEATRGYVIVVDLKTGFEGRVRDHRPQLMSLAAMLSRAWGARGAVLMVLHLKDGDVQTDAEIVEDYELDAHIAILQARWRETPTAQPNPGAHCTGMWCDALDSCPAAARAAEIVPVDRLTVKLRGPIESAEEAAARVALLKPLREWVDRYEGECKEWVRDHGAVELPPGGIDRWWGEVASSVREIDTSDEAMALLREEFGAKGIATLGKISVTQASIKRELIAQGRSHVVDELDRIMKALDKAGAIKKRERKQFEFRERAPFALPVSARSKDVAAATPAAMSFADADEGPL